MLQALCVNPSQCLACSVNPFPLPCLQSSSRQALCPHHGHMPGLEYSELCVLQIVTHDLGDKREEKQCQGSGVG